ncbi:hypothetical protein HGP17_14735 [Rhizobium sp. P38BS-XIX]|uniref:hypothetical protein n=1 Tax=Rhizobium sp. P38BS-XIX TaxID=2726740 RepID=UPI001456EAA1|nr:hypothetical protein [Rhizobium sp. P38BS-XIX]NLR98070.1 hypothetical protein [Rhizobium sp. P38BS-XIX]
MREEKLRETKEIAETIRQLAKPGMKPKALIDAVRQRYPDATKKDVARAAFLSVIMAAEYDPEDTQALHDIAMSARDEDDGEP